jgi:hypothetical protein
MNKYINLIHIFILLYPSTLNRSYWRKFKTNQKGEGENTLNEIDRESNTAREVANYRRSSFTHRFVTRFSFLILSYMLNLNS